MAPLSKHVTSLLLVTNTIALSQTCTNSKSATCWVDCNADHGCEDYFIFCRSGVPCIVDCRHIEACEGAIIDGRSATDVYIFCDYPSESCYNANIQCGTGDCVLHCGSGRNWNSQTCTKATLDASRSRSFQCTGNCPFTASIFSPKPTTSPLMDDQTGHPTLSPTVDEYVDPVVDENSIPQQDTTDKPTTTTMPTIPISNRITTSTSTTTSEESEPDVIPSVSTTTSTTTFTTKLITTSTSTSTSTTQLKGIMGYVNAQDYSDGVAQEKTPSPVDGDIFANMLSPKKQDDWIVFIVIAIGAVFCCAAAGLLGCLVPLKKGKSPEVKVQVVRYGEKEPFKE